MATLLWYDFFLTLGEEAQYVWKTKPYFSVAKVLWFLASDIDASTPRPFAHPLLRTDIGHWRAFVCVYGQWHISNQPNLRTSDLAIQERLLISNDRCDIALQFTAWSGMFNIAIVDILLMLRVWALYNGSRRVMWFLIAVFVIGLPSAIAIRKVPPLPSIPLIKPAPQTLTGCKRSPPSELFSLFTMALAIDTIIFAMVIIKAWGKKFRSSTPVLTVLVRDGALYYAAITAILVFMIAATMIPILYQPVADA
ncbi:hypothetical protein FRC17_003855, partial [Serendipita sp. 399]